MLKETGRVYNKYEHRNTLEGILYRMRTGIQWRDLPERFGRWNSVFKRFNLWSKKGVLQKWFQSISSDNDPEWLFIDGSIVKAHQDSSGAASSSDEAIGKSRGGSSTKIHLAVDSGGLPVYFEISGGQINDIGYVKKTDAETQVLFEFIAHRYESGSLIITANHPFSAWDQIFPDSMMTVAAIDRLIHHATIIELEGESYRKQHQLKQAGSRKNEKT
ncbi:MULTISPECIES: IS5 family transposase [Acinetobacter]|uniref:IS5 family transposase n=9 Tax=Moraxellaceae TaxID=468 RepID=A0AA42MCN8_ACIJO|nr:MULTISPECIES: IS5 family transposase [Acinetobacter]EKT9380118.1 IS5 family transposase [Acinetobacter baumannii]EKU0759464.1 IS5 family transposase [Acinetobacter baumannii]EKV8394062.1 IS5 family transposase [Acinetobacter baumannii]EKW0730832.1 IS5 family transposase [Acinetobacter baumannii]EKW0739171.1 IS5 family transposase [Acinetobacter baumannii]